MAEEVARSSEEAGIPVAVSLALAGASREDANAFLKDQRVLIAEQCALAKDQRQHLHEQLNQIHLDVWEKRLGVLLRVATAFIGVAVAAALGWLIWNAANSNDLVIDSFTVPPDLAARGLSGPVVAAKLSDKILTMQAQTSSARPPKSYASGYAEGLKLEIPQTGVSLSELDRFLREKLGHDLHIGGEMVQTDQGVALTARVGNNGSATVAGAEAELDALLQKLAEQVYRITQPFRFGNWLRIHGRIEENIAVMKDLTTNGPNVERAWGYFGWGGSASQYQSDSANQPLLRRGLALDPDNYLILSGIAAAEYRFGRWQDSQRDNGATLVALLAHGRDYSLPGARAGLEQDTRGLMLMFQGALLEAARQARTAIVEDARYEARFPLWSVRLADILVALHEPGASRAALAEFFRIAPNYVAPNFGNPGYSAIGALRTRLTIALEAHDWPGVMSTERALPQVLTNYPGLAEDQPVMIDPLVALALAHMGQFSEAEARLKPSPADCYPCLRARAQVAALQSQDSRAEFWFARATAIAPSLPYAESEWGRALLDRGKPDEAIEKFKLANQKGPHFADPLEGWGEALMAKNQSHLALAKFAEADKYAPNWGRLHLKWGEALVYAGKRDDAGKQFARAAQLDLAPSEKAELARMGHV
jgi:tetratricopeptide (TPR) repeat protein